MNTHRGHQAPLANLEESRIFFQINYLSNITPQKANLNSESWRILESRIRKMLQDESISKVYIMTEPLYEKKVLSLPEADESHKIPNGYWKIVANKKGSNIKTVLFIFSQDTMYSFPLLDHLVTFNEIENRSGLNFFWELKEYRENVLEHKKNKNWAAKYFSDA